MPYISGRWDMPFNRSVIKTLLVMAACAVLVCSCGGGAIEVEEYRRITRENPDEADTLYNLGIAYSLLERDPEAARSFEEAVRLKPDDADALFYLGSSYSIMGREADAAGAYRKAFALGPVVSKHFRMGLAYYTLGLYEQATEELKAAIEAREPHPLRSLVTMGMANTQLGRFQEGIDAFLGAMKVNQSAAESFFNVHFYLGMNYQALGQNETAEVAYRHAISINPEFPYAYLNLGILFAAKGDTSSAMQVHEILTGIDMKTAARLLESLQQSEPVESDR